MRTRRQWMGAVLVSAYVVLAGIPPATASPPGNDAFVDADVVSALPFADSGDLENMTTEPGEPASPCLPSPMQTAWYVFSPAGSGSVKVDLAGSDFPVVVVGYESTAGGLGGLTFLRCTVSGPGDRSFVLPVTAGSTYYLQAGMYVPGPSHLELHLSAVTPPPNDDFADAAPLGAAPTGATVDLTAATVEPGEPAPAGWTIGASAWYAYTPAADGTALVRSNGFDPSAVLAVYTGTSLTGLTQVASGQGTFPPLSFTAQAGTTYSIQAARSLSGPSFSPVVSFTVEAPGPPQASFFASPSDPSIYDTVQFNDFSFDPAYVGFGPAQWDFGDGATVTASCCVNHRYAADGDYTATLTVTTLDGRTATTTQVVRVRTHDVAIVRIHAPNSARVGQTRTVTVNLGGGRYPETVQVDLYKSVAGGFDEFVGTTTVAVPAARGGRTTNVGFDYTATPADGQVGKVTFRAVATIVGARDALPGDNQAIAPPMEVKR